MRVSGWFTISLAAKCQMLFALAVSTIIAVALIVPLKWMNAQVHKRGTDRARRMALVAATRSALPDGDWSQEAMDAWWATQTRGLMSEVYGPTSPRLIRLADQVEAPELDPFVALAVRRFREQTHLEDAARWGEDATGTIRYHYVLPVRTSEGELAGVVYTTTVAGPDALAELWWNLVAVGAAAVLAGMLAVLVFYLITTKLILSPVKKLERLAQQVAGGDLEVRSELRTGDEYEQLATAFNDMLDSLNQKQEELRRINISLDTRLGEVAEANVALLEANKLKSEFLANVSHELRTPLTSIIGFAELLRDHPAGQEERIHRYVLNILSSGRMLLDLINDLLDLAKIEAGRMELRVGKVNLPDLCQDLIDFMRPMADKKQLRLVLEVPGEIPLLDSDGGKIQQILYNLLSNAIKFTPTAGRVALRAEPVDDQMAVRIVVSDTGPGIPVELQGQIFEKFRQIDASVTREHGGTGLGLPISKELTAMLGGTLSLASLPGEGAVFTVVLPLTAPEQSRRMMISLS